MLEHGELSKKNLSTFLTAENVAFFATVSEYPARSWEDSKCSKKYEVTVDMQAIRLYKPCQNTESQRLQKHGADTGQHKILDVVSSCICITFQDFGSPP